MQNACIIYYANNRLLAWCLLVYIKQNLLYLANERASLNVNDKRALYIIGICGSIDLQGLQRFSSSSEDDNENYYHLFVVSDDTPNFKQGIYQYDIRTGGILDNDSVVYEVGEYKHSNHDFDIEPLQDKRHWYDSRDTEELIQLCDYSSYDKSDNASLWRSDKVYHFIANHMVSSEMFYLFVTLSEHIIRRNVAIIGRDELCLLLNTNKTNLSRTLKRIEKSGIIKFTKPLGNKSTQYTILFHPVLVWKGEYSLRTRLEYSVLAANCEWWKVRSLYSEYEDQ